MRGAGAGDDSSEAKVDDFCRAGFGDDDVGRLDVTVNDVLRVGGAEAASNLDRQIESFAEWQAAVRKLLSEGSALVILHDDEEVVIGSFFKAVYDANVGMVQGRGSASLAAENVLVANTNGSVVGKKFKGDSAFELGVEGLVDDTHPAGAKFFGDAVVADRLSEQRKTSLRTSGGRRRGWFRLRHRRPGGGALHGILGFAGV